MCTSLEDVGKAVRLVTSLCIALVVSYRMVRYGLWHGTGTVRYTVVWYDTVWCGTLYGIYRDIGSRGQMSRGGGAVVLNRSPHPTPPHKPHVTRSGSFPISSMLHPCRYRTPLPCPPATSSISPPDTPPPCQCRTPSLAPPPIWPLLRDPYIPASLASVGTDPLTP